MYRYSQIKQNFVGDRQFTIDQVGNVPFFVRYNSSQCHTFDSMVSTNWFVTRENPFRIVIPCTRSWTWAVSCDSVETQTYDWRNLIENSNSIRAIIYQFSHRQLSSGPCLDWYQSNGGQKMNSKTFEPEQAYGMTRIKSQLLDWFASTIH